jgi:HD-like signal output (HDOD) protein
VTVAPARSFLEHVQALPTPPAAAQQILAATSAPRIAPEEIARVLSRDPAIAAQILRIANSPYYGVSREITQISRAVVLLGARAVRSFVVAICARRALATPDPTPEQNLVWQHALAAGTAGELIARDVGYRPTEEAFVAGLLHDVGHLAMVCFDPERVRAILADALDENGRLQREADAFGLDHAAAGNRILSAWNFPAPLCTAARRHHEPPAQLEGEVGRLCAIVVLADGLAHLLGLGFDVPVGGLRQMDAVAAQLGLSRSGQLRVLATLERRLAETREVLACISAPLAEAPASATPRRALWIDAEGGDAPDTGRFLLERAGFQVDRVAAADAPAGDGYDLVLLDCGAHEPVAVAAAARDLRAGGRDVVVLYDAPDGTPPRGQDAALGVCYIPRLFTAVDLDWAQRTLQA